jgi:predicted transcriptional regulator
MSSELQDIAMHLDRIATSMEESAAMAQQMINVDPGQQISDAIEAMKKSNPVMKAAFEQTERLLLGQPPTNKGEIDASRSD